jgi:hypothetical protein
MILPGGRPYLTLLPLPHSPHFPFLLCCSVPFNRGSGHGRTARGGHELHQVSQGSTMPFLLRTASEDPINGLTAISGVAAHTVGSLRPFYYPLDTPRRTPLGLASLSEDKKSSLPTLTAEITT